MKTGILFIKIRKSKGILFLLFSLFTLVCFNRCSSSSKENEDNSNKEIEFRLEKEQNELERYYFSSKANCEKCSPFNFSKNVYLVNTSFDEIFEFTLKTSLKSTHIKKVINLSSMDDEDFDNFNSFISSLNLSSSKNNTDAPVISKSTEVL